MRILFIHQNFPGQFRRIAQSLAAQPGWEVLVGLGRRTVSGMEGVRWLSKTQQPDTALLRANRPIGNFWNETSSRPPNLPL